MNRLFWRGFHVGALTGLLLATAFLFGVPRQGVTISVDAGLLGEQVESAVRRQVAAQLPAALAAVEDQLPELVAGRVAEHLTAGELNVGPVALELPPGLAAELRTRLTAALTEAGRSYLAGLDQEALAARAGREARALVQERLLTGGVGYRFQVRLLPWLVLPVTLEGR